jgi:hypothetical protein
MNRWQQEEAEMLFAEYQKQRDLYSAQAASALPDEAVEALRIRRRRKATMGIEIMAMTAKQDDNTGSIIIKTEIAVSMRELVELSSAGQFPDLIADKLMIKRRKEIEATVRRLMGKG